MNYLCSISSYTDIWTSGSSYECPLCLKRPKLYFLLLRKRETCRDLNYRDSITCIQIIFRTRYIVTSQSGGLSTNFCFCIPFHLPPPTSTTDLNMLPQNMLQNQRWHEESHVISEGSKKRIARTFSKS